jgi:hypothetical protein
MNIAFRLRGAPSKLRLGGDFHPSSANQFPGTHYLFA